MILHYKLNSVGNWECPLKKCKDGQNLTRRDSVYRHVVWHHPEYISLDPKLINEGFSVEKLKNSPLAKKGICIICKSNGIDKKLTDEDALYRHYSTHKEVIFNIEVEERPLLPHLRKEGEVVEKGIKLLRIFKSNSTLSNEITGEIYYPEKKVREHFGIPPERKATDGAFHYVDCPYIFVEDKGKDILTAIKQIGEMIKITMRKGHDVPFAIIITTKYDRWMKKKYPRTRYWVLDTNRINGVKWPFKNVKIFVVQRKERIDDLFRRMQRVGITQWP